MKWKALAACALTAVALAVAGCGGGQSSSGKAGAPQGPDLKGKKLVMYVSFHEDTAKELADLFKKKTGADVSFIRLPTGEALARIQAEMQEVMKQEKKSQQMLEDAFRGIGYGID